MDTSKSFRIYRGIAWQPLLLAIGLLTATTGVNAANECRVEYGYHTGSGFNRTDHVKKEYLNAGQSKSFNQGKMNYVKNLKDNKAKFNLQGASSVTLDKNMVNPSVSYYLASVTLSSVACLNQTSAPAFGSPAALINAYKQANNSAEEIAQALKDVFNLGGQQIAQLMRAANFAADVVAEALKDVFSATSQQIASWLKAAGYSAEQTLAALLNGLNLSAQQAAAIIASVFNATNQQIASWLKAAGYSAEQTLAALKNGLNLSAQQAATIMSSVFNASVSQLAQWLKNAGYSLIQVAQTLESIESDPQKVTQALRQAFNLSADQLVQTLKQIQKIITTQNCGVAGCNQGATLLKNIGYALNDTVKALKTHYNISVQTAYDIAKNVYGASNTAIEQALAFAGYTSRQIATVVNQGTKVVVGSVQTTSRVAREQTELSLYDAYFKIVAAGTRMVSMHSTYRNALNKAGINVNSVRVGYSSYLDPSDVAMADCEKIYFPSSDLVNRLNKGSSISLSELHWLLHELGHTVQCRASSRQGFASRWFSELSPAVVTSIESGKPNAKAIHDAMPLEQQADGHADRHLRDLARALGIR